MRFLFLTFLISGLIALPVHGQTQLGEDRGEAFSPEGRFFQSLDCDSSGPRNPFRSEVSTRKGLIQLAESQNLLGEVIANPFCSLANAQAGNNPFPDFIKLMASECPKPQKGERKTKACALVPVVQKYKELVSRINQGPKVSLVSVPEDWSLIDLRAGNWSETFNFDTRFDHNGGAPVIYDLLLAETAIWTSLQSTVDWLHSLAAPRTNVGPMAAQAVGRLYGNYLGMRFYSLYNMWTCRPLSRRSELDLDACGIHRDILFLILSDAVSDLRKDAKETIVLVEKLREFLKHHSGRRETGIADVPVQVSDARVKRFQLILDLDSVLHRLQKSARGYRNLEELFQSTESLELMKLLTTRVDPSLMLDYNSADGPAGLTSDTKFETAAYRSFSETLALLRLISLLDSHQMADPEISRRQYALWANTHIVTELKKEIRDYLRESINRVDAFIEKGAGS